MSGTLQVYVWREGLLARFGHDLRISAERFDVRHGPQSLVRVAVADLHVDGAVRDARLTAMSDRDRRDAERSMRIEVLHGDAHPTIEFEGRYEDGQVQGTLSLLGRREPLAFPAIVEEGRIHGRFDLQPSRWGIPPYTALFGALKLQDRVTIVFDAAAA